MNLGLIRSHLVSLKATTRPVAVFSDASLMLILLNQRQQQNGILVQIVNLPPPLLSLSVLRMSKRKAYLLVLDLP